MTCFVNFARGNGLVVLERFETCQLAARVLELDFDFSKSDFELRI